MLSAPQPAVPQFAGGPHRCYRRHFVGPYRYRRAVPGVAMLTTRAASDRDSSDKTVAVMGSDMGLRRIGTRSDRVPREYRFASRSGTI